jgi:hypothetical protein
VVHRSPGRQRKEYFSARRSFFEESVRGEIEAPVTEPSTSFGAEVKMFRQNRDIRGVTNEMRFVVGTAPSAAQRVD